MERAEPSGPSRDNLADDPSVASSLEHLAAASQGMITKRFDLALLEARELLSRTFQGAALMGLGVAFAAAAWFAAAASLVLLLMPEASWVVRLAAFGLLNGGCAVALFALAMRHNRLQRRVRPSDNAGRPGTTV